MVLAAANKMFWKQLDVSEVEEDSDEDEARSQPYEPTSSQRDTDEEEGEEWSEEEEEEGLESAQSRPRKRRKRRRLAPPVDTPGRRVPWREFPGVKSFGSYGCCSPRSLLAVCAHLRKAATVLWIVWRLDTSAADVAQRRALRRWARQRQLYATQRQAAPHGSLRSVHRDWKRCWTVPADFTNDA